MRHGAHLDPPNRFESVRLETELDHVQWDTEFLTDRLKQKIEYLEDKSSSIVSENKSPDLNFRFSVNPYRGCVHACSYCYARPYHEFLGFNAGRDFETKIMVKHKAPELLRDFLAKPSWRAELIAFSGVTDCYQPAERRFQLTRRCFEVAAAASQPIGIVTKNALVVRDLDILAPMAAQHLASVCVSITTLDQGLARVMEPRTSTPDARLRAIRELAAAGVPTKVMVSPVIPGLNDSEIPAILKAAREAGAVSASYILLRLPLTVEPVFVEWLERTQPARKEMVLNRIRHCRAGELNDSTFSARMRGSGEIAEQVQRLFTVFSQKYELNQPLPAPNCELFTHPVPASGQRRLF